MKANPRRARPMCRKKTVGDAGDGDDVEFVCERPRGGGIYAIQAGSGFCNTAIVLSVLLLPADMSATTRAAPHLRHRCR